MYIIQKAISYDWFISANQWIKLKTPTFSINIAASELSTERETFRFC